MDATTCYWPWMHPGHMDASISFTWLHPNYSAVASTFFILCGRFHVFYFFYFWIQPFIIKTRHGCTHPIWMHPHLCLVTAGCIHSEWMQPPICLVVVVDASTSDQTSIWVQPYTHIFVKRFHYILPFCNQVSSTFGVKYPPLILFQRLRYINTYTYIFLRFFHSISVSKSKNYHIGRLEVRCCPLFAPCAQRATWRPLHDASQSSIAYHI